MRRSDVVFADRATSVVTTMSCRHPVDRPASVNRSFCIRICQHVGRNGQRRKGGCEILHRERDVNANNQKEPLVVCDIHELLREKTHTASVLMEHMRSGRPERVSHPNVARRYPGCTVQRFTSLFDIIRAASWKLLVRFCGTAVKWNDQDPDHRLGLKRSSSRRNLTVGHFSERL